MKILTGYVSLQMIGGDERGSMTISHVIYSDWHACVQPVF